jgi:hypothetical protein
LEDFEISKVESLGHLSAQLWDSSKSFEDSQSFKPRVTDSKMASISLLNLNSIAATLIASLLLTIMGYFLPNEWTRYRSRIKGLSGPTGLPVIGNLHQVLPPPTPLNP